MKTVINIALPLGFLGGRPAVATTRDEQKRDPDGKFGSGGGGGRGSPSSAGGKKADELTARHKAMAEEHKKEGPTAWKHGNSAKEHHSEADRHRKLAKKGGPAASMHENAANAHTAAATAHEQARSALNKGDLVKHQEHKKRAQRLENEASAHAERIYNKHGPY